MSKAVTKKRPSYDAKTTHRALIELAGANGNSRMAAARLKADGISIDQKTLWRWKTEKADQYARIREEVMPALREKAAEESFALAESYAEAERKFITRLTAEAEDIPIRDLAGATRNVATSRAIHIDKASQLRGEATGAAGTDKRTTREILRSLQSKGVEIEVVDAEVVSEETVSA